MNLYSLYDIAERENIKIYNHYIDNAKGIFINYKNMNAIFMNTANIINTLDEKCVLSEELGHYYMDALYPALSNDTILISKQEYRAKKWSYYALIPFEKLQLAILSRS